LSAITNEEKFWCKNCYKNSDAECKKIYITIQKQKEYRILSSLVSPLLTKHRNKSKRPNNFTFHKKWVVKNDLQKNLVFGVTDLSIKRINQKKEAT